MISTTNFASAWQQDNTVLSIVSNLNENKSDQTLCLHHLILARKTSLLFTYSFPLLHRNQHLHRNHQSAQALLTWINLFAAYMKCCSQKRIQASWSDARGFFFGTQLMPSQKKFYQSTSIPTTSRRSVATWIIMVSSMWDHFRQLDQKQLLFGLTRTWPRGVLVIFTKASGSKELRHVKPIRQQKTVGSERKKQKSLSKTLAIARGLCKQNIFIKLRKRLQKAVTTRMLRPSPTRNVLLRKTSVAFGFIFFEIWVKYHLSSPVGAHLIPLRWLHFWEIRHLEAI